MSKFIVIGGAGYIGSHLVHAIHQRGAHAVVFDNLSTGNLDNLPAWREDRPVDVIEGDIRNCSQLHSLFKNHPDTECVFHFAALKAAGESMVNPNPFLDVNINGTNNILRVMDIYGIRNLVFSSSAAIYGNPEYLPIDENHPTNPTNFYGYTKCQMEKTMEWYSMLGKIRYAALRYFNAAGYMRDGSIMEPENNPTNLLPVVMEVASERRGPVKIFGTDYDTVDGTGVRDYIHVEDLAQAHILAAQYLKDNRKDLIVNLGTEVGHSVMEVIHKADHATGVTIPYNVCPRRPGDPSTVIASSSKALETLGWRAEYSSLEEILASMWNVYRSL